MNKNLVENRELREEVISRIEVLEQVKNVLTLESTDFSTVKLAAEYYEVEIKALEKTIERNRRELEEDGLRLYKNKEIKEMLETVENTKNLQIPSRGLTLIPKRALLRIGMLLRDSEVARKVRELLLKEYPELYAELSKGNTIRFKRYEEEIGNYLEFSFGKENVKRQVRCGKYLLDFVLFDKYHIEVDENGHIGYDYDKESARYDYILDNTDYLTIRYNPHKDTPYQLITKIFETKNYLSMIKMNMYDLHKTNVDNDISYDNFNNYREIDYEFLADSFAVDVIDRYYRITNKI